MRRHAAAVVARQQRRVVESHAANRGAVHMHAAVRLQLLRRWQVDTPTPNQRIEAVSEQTYQLNSQHIPAGAPLVC